MKSRPRKTLAAVALLVALVFALTGCIHMSLNLKINTDDSVDWSYDMLMADTLAGMTGDTDIWGEATTQVEAQGFKVEKLPATEDGYSGIRVSKHYDSIEAFNSDQTKLAGTQSTAQGAESELTLTKDQDGTINFAMKMDASQAMAQSTSQEGMDDATKQMMQGFIDQMQVNVSVTLPYKAASHNATSVSADGLTYTWKMDLTKPNDIQLTASAPSGTNLLLIGGIAAAGVIVIVAVVLIAVSVSKKNKAKAAAEQPPAV